MFSKKNEKNKPYFCRLARFFCVCNKNNKKYKENAPSPRKIDNILQENEENLANPANFYVATPKSVTDNSERKESVAKIQQKTRKIGVKTRHLVSTIEFREFKPKKVEEIGRFPYCCPICFRYFNKIYKSTCCGNYCCYFCVKDMNSYIKKAEKLSIHCNFCSCEEFFFVDVLKKEQVKIYTDSPFTEKENYTKEPQQINVNKALVTDFAQINLDFNGENSEKIENKENLQEKNKNDSFSSSFVNRSPSPINGNLDKMNKLMGIGCEILKENYIKNNKQSVFKKIDEKNNRTLHASRNYLVDGKSCCFQ